MARRNSRLPPGSMACFSLVAEIGWLASTSPSTIAATPGCFSLVAEIGWLARPNGGRLRSTSPRFQSRCRDWVVGEGDPTPVKVGDKLVSVSLPRLGGWRGYLRPMRHRPQGQSFSLVAEIGWLASSRSLDVAKQPGAFQSRCRDWVVGEGPAAGPAAGHRTFQSRCRDWVVGELGKVHLRALNAVVVSVSLPRLGGWRALSTLGLGALKPGFSLVAEIGWLARIAH